MSNQGDKAQPRPISNPEPDSAVPLTAAASFLLRRVAQRWSCDERRIVTEREALEIIINRSLDRSGAPRAEVF